MPVRAEAGANRKNLGWRMVGRCASRLQSRFGGWCPCRPPWGLNSSGGEGRRLGPRRRWLVLGDCAVRGPGVGDLLRVGRVSGDLPSGTRPAAGYRRSRRRPHSRAASIV
jgi:hypothetical protein